MKKLACLGIAAAAAVGCTQSASTPSTPQQDGSSLVLEGAPPPTVETHTHPTEGPHHGSLIELGNEEYHAELVHDDSSVTIYLLDAAASNAVPVEAAEVVINLIREGAPEQFKLSASPGSGDTTGRSSRFVSHDAALVTALDQENASPKLSVMISGKSYRGGIRHDHHDDHDH